MQESSRPTFLEPLVTMRSQKKSATFSENPGSRAFEYFASSLRQLNSSCSRSSRGMWFLIWSKMNSSCCSLNYMEQSEMIL